MSIRKPSRPAPTRRWRAGSLPWPVCPTPTLPLTTRPSFTSSSARRKKKATATFFPSAVSPSAGKARKWPNWANLKKAGAVALSDDGAPIMNAELMRRVMEYAKMLDLTVIDHCEDSTFPTRGDARGGSLHGAGPPGNSSGFRNRHGRAAISCWRK